MSTSEMLDDIAAVRAVVQLYVDGACGDGAKLRQAFHADAQMFGHLGDTRRDMPIVKFIEGVESSKQSLAGPDYRADISSVVVTGRVAVAYLVETDYRGSDFVDVFTCSKFDDGWKIVSKTFTCTRPPQPL